MIQDATYHVVYRTPSGRRGERLVRGTKLITVINSLRDKGYTCIEVL